MDNKHNHIIVVLQEEGDEIMLKYWRFLVFFVVVLASISAIFLKPQYSGVQIAYIYSDSPAKGILQNGMIISEVDGKPVGSVD